jgi:hypothetical protein
MYLSVCLTQWEKVPQAASYQERKQTLRQLVSAKLTHILTILRQPTTFFDKFHRLMVSFIWEGLHWRLPNFVHDRLENGGVDTNHFPTRIKTLRFSFLQNFIASSDTGIAWYFQAWRIRAYAQVLHAEDVLRLKLYSTRFQAMPPFMPTHLKAGIA